jgi:hypothetical protein
MESRINLRKRDKRLIVLRRMATKKKRNAVTAYLAKIGRKGGQAKVPKGVAALSEEDRKKLGEKAAAARWGKRTK